ncbi:sensor histidine kinase [Kitasatospora camelliae]|uniref:histidine kinase n=1 Tax=Kitasatospora camelliae TaxID=3156397 RepID=A0AAU8JWM0_9ACTN
MSPSIFHRAVQRAAAHAPWSAAARRDTLLLAAGVPLSAPVLILLGLPRLWFVLVAFLPCLDLLSVAQRSRLRALRGLLIPSRAPRNAGWWGKVRAGLTWRQFLYHLVVAPLQTLGALLVLAGWGIGLVMATVLGWIWLMPAGAPLQSRPGWAVADGWTTLGGAALLFLTPWLAALLSRFEEWAAGSLLGLNRAELLQRRVEDLAESRAGVVDAADAERRRIERDLHDGAQQRLVSLAMNLGLARRTLKDVPAEAMRVIVEAHEEAQAAIDELRDLVRGLHPVVLEDRGLDAALSGIAARCPVPVRLDIDLSDDIAPTVEAVAYFTVSEALTNAAKHSRASRVELSIRQRDGRLHIQIHDDGIGGADAARGTGLTGLRKRAASVDGTLAVTSPHGGPTTITAELPCEL